MSITFFLQWRMHILTNIISWLEKFSTYKTVLQQAYIIGLMSQ